MKVVIQKMISCDLNNNLLHHDDSIETIQQRNSKSIQWPSLVYYGHTDLDYSNVPVFYCNPYNLIF